MLALALLGFLIALAVTLFPLGAIVLWAMWRRRSDRRRSPLTTAFQHLPGEQARNEAERLMEKANERLMIAVSIAPAVLMAWAFQRIDPRALRFGWPEFLLLVLTVAMVCALGIWGVKLLQLRRHYLDGEAAERATAQELLPLLAQGCVIYHDVPAEGFNLDHVVVGPDKVYMVETKSRRKPQGPGKSKVQVSFDGTALAFPGWRETRMLDQTRGQTRWLSDYLYRKTGERVQVEPVLALPGWFVTCTVPTPDVRVINPGMHNFMAHSDGHPTPAPQRRRIMTALEERYRVAHEG